MQKFNSSANIDLRFDQTDVNSNGQLVNSFEACKPIVDKILADGYTSITLQTNVPIDPATGLIRTIDNLHNIGQVRKLPVDFWQIADYAKEIGLDIVLKAEPVDCYTDSVFGTWLNTGPAFNVNNFFNSIKTYQVELAKQAQAHGVETVYIGYWNGGFDQQEYQHYWRDIVNSVRQVFDGKIAYTGILGYDNAVWGLVDEIHVAFNPNLTDANTMPTGIAGIVNEYREDDQQWGSSVVDAIRAVTTKYNKDVILDAVTFNAGSDSLDNSADLWTDALNSVTTDGAVNLNLTESRITGFFELLRTDLATDVIGVSTREYMPWMQADWIQNPTHLTGDAFNHYGDLGFDLYDQPEVAAIYERFLNGFDQEIIGTDESDNIWVASGDHTVNGGLGVDTLDLSATTLSDVTIRKINNSEYRVTWEHGVSTISNIERIEFNGTDLAFDVDGHGGQAYRLYKAAFDRVPDQQGLGYWIDALDDGASLTGVASGFVNSPEFQHKYGSNISDHTFVYQLYQNVLDRPPEAAGFDYWVNAMQNGMTRESVLTCFSESLENQHNVEPLIAVGIPYQEWIG